MMVIGSQLDLFEKKLEKRSSALVCGTWTLAGMS